jgi:hypothetical protein
MLLPFILSFLQPFAPPFGSMPAVAYTNIDPLPFPVPALAQPTYSAEEERVTELRRSLFKTARPALLSHDLPAPEGMDGPRLVSVNYVSDGPLRELGAQPAGFTPYDSYLGTIRTVMSRAGGKRASLAETCKSMRVAHAFRYADRDPYRADPPAVTAARKEGDCKSKALWLYDQLGDASALYVIGKIDKRRKASHAWLYWRYEGRWWILDPTNQSAPIAADAIGSKRYVPYYSFAQSGKYRHPATAMLVASNPPRVASKTF